MPALDEDSQFAELEAAGLDMAGVWTDHLTTAAMRRADPAELEARAMAIRQLRPGDQFVVMGLPVLGLNIRDFLDCMAAIAAKGASLFDLETQREYRFSPEGAVLLEAVAGYERRRKSLQTEHARAAAEEMRRKRGIKAGRLPVLTPARQEEAKADWQSPELSGREIAEKYRVSVRTLYNMFGARTARPLRRKRMKQK